MMVGPYTLDGKECIRAGGNGTAGTAMAVPVFEGKKWRRLDSNLACMRYRMSSLSASP